MGKELKCDSAQCGKRMSEDEASEWWKLESVGVTSTWRRESLPLVFCSLACLRAFVAERP